MKNRGFTLVELLAVIVLLGVILLIAVPSVSKLQGTVNDRKIAKDKEMFKSLVEQKISSDIDITIHDYAYFCLNSNIVTVEGTSYDCINIKAKGKLNGEYKDDSYVKVIDDYCSYGSNGEYSCTISDDDDVVHLEEAVK